MLGRFLKRGDLPRKPDEGDAMTKRLLMLGLLALVAVPTVTTAAPTGPIVIPTIPTDPSATGTQIGDNPPKDPDDTGGVRPKDPGPTKARGA